MSSSQAGEEVSVCGDVNIGESWVLLTSERDKSGVTSPAWPCDSTRWEIPDVLLTPHV